jgi:transcriptional regulator with GAF, ATPase, and Fis domain
MFPDTSWAEALQPNLQAITQERECEPFGRRTPIQADVRLVCATNRNLRELVEERALCADLFYRLTLVPVEVVTAPTSPRSWGPVD